MNGYEFSFFIEKRRVTIRVAFFLKKNSVCSKCLEKKCFKKAEENSKSNSDTVKK